MTCEASLLLLHYGTACEHAELASLAPTVWYRALHLPPYTTTLHFPMTLAQSLINHKHRHRNLLLLTLPSQTQTMQSLRPILLCLAMLAPTLKTSQAQSVSVPLSDFVLSGGSAIVTDSEDYISVPGGNAELGREPHRQHLLHGP